MKIAVVGSRDFPDESAVRRAVVEVKNRFLGPGYYPVIVSGGARGPDQWAVDEAIRLGLETLVFLADWSKGKGAGLARNTLIVEHCDEVIAFWDGKSRGTLDTITKAVRAGKPVEIRPAPSLPSSGASRPSAE